MSMSHDVEVAAWTDLRGVVPPVALETRLAARLEAVRLGDCDEAEREGSAEDEDADHQNFTPNALRIVFTWIL